jgi:formylglycine-generating enzyme required for sulfatase activity
MVRRTLLPAAPPPIRASMRGGLARRHRPEPLSVVVFVGAAWVSMAGVACSSREPSVRPPATSAQQVGDVGPSPSAPAATSSPSAAPEPSPAGPPATSASATVSSATPKAPPAPPEGMLFVPGGTFVMGLDKGGQLDETPAHEVTLRGFYLDRTEVTNEAYNACVDKGVCRGHDKASAEVNHLGKDADYRRPQQPISAVSWDDATTYCGFLGKRLPREAEWERAARGDDQRMFPWGNQKATRELAVFGEPHTKEVGSREKGKGPYGHVDLAGNVWEWVDDLYDPYAYRRPGAKEGKPGTCEEIMATLDELRRTKQQGFTGTNPIPIECERGLRGGAFNYDGPGLRSSNRVHHPGRFRLVMSGFRCAKDAPAEASE